MRAREPDHRGLLDRDGVRVAYEIHGIEHATAPPIVFLPTFPVVHTYELFKAQIPHLARRRRVLVLDPRGHGRSDRPTDPAAYTHTQRVGDVLTLLEETGTDRAVMVGMSQGGPLAVRVAAALPDHTIAAIAIAPTWQIDKHTPTAPEDQQFDPERWAHEDVYYFRIPSFREHYDDFVRELAESAHTEAHSIKMIEDTIRFGRETTAEVIAAHMFGQIVSWPPPGESVERFARRVHCPVMIIHGSADRMDAVESSEQAAPWFDARLEIVPRGSHGVHGRRPVQVNALIDDFLDDVAGPPDPAGGRAIRPRGASPSSTSATTGPRVLYLSSPIGLGHARRDLAIADELRALAPDVTIDWLTQDPVTRVLAARNESVHPASAHLANESAHLESEAGEHQLHAFEAMRRMDEILIANFMIFREVIRDGAYDLVIGDEAWDVDHYLHEEPRAKATRFAWLTDFVGELPMPAHGRRGVELTADRNAEMIGHIERHPEIRDAAILVGDPDDVVDLPFGPGLPSIRDWTRDHYQFSGYITGFDPAALGRRADLRTEFGYGPGEVVCVAAVGGSGVGASLLRRIIAAHMLAVRQIPELRTVLVTGPRIEPASLPSAPRLDKHAYVPDLHRRFAAADLAVVQGGLTTTMELAALGVPFLYLPLLDHFEQQIHVRHRLQRHHAGTAIDYATTDAETLANSMIQTIGATTSARPIVTDGARQAAKMLCRLL